MFIVQLTYKKPIAEVEKFRQAHREYLDYYYKQGLILVSGPMKPQTGGLIVVLSKDKKALEQICENDPYHVADVADYQILEFTPVSHREELQELILKTEGKLC